MSEIELLIDFHKNASRQGPGSEHDTLKALSFLDLKKGIPLKVADIGCGSGAQTITLAQHLAGQVIAVDLFPEFLEKLKAKSVDFGIAEKIITLAQSMDNLPFDAEEFDIIWSEGAVYILGFEVGIKQWKKFLKPGGYMVLSEITWTTHSRPKEIEMHWQQEYPHIGTASSKMKILEENGFSPVGYFFLPESSWIANYYQPIEDRFDSFLEKHQYSEAAKNLVAAEKTEISFFRKYKDYFSYGFYIAKKL